MKDGLVYMLRGNLLYRRGDNNQLDVKNVLIDGGSWGYDAIYYKFAANHALLYKSLQTNLEEKISGLSRADVRFHETADNTMFKTLINQTELLKVIESNHNTNENTYEKIYTDVEGGTAGNKILAIVNGDYSVGSSYTGGLVIATGDVYVRTGTTPFKGTIISGGTISFAANASVDSDEVFVSQLISQDIRKAIPEFATIFQGYEASAEAAMGTSTISKYLTYENWTKVVE